LKDNEQQRLEHQIQLASRAVSYITDESTAQRLLRFVEELKARLFRSSRQKQIAQRAFELWDRAGRPPGRDLEFWLAAEKELGERS
jgi:hypothetical protein